VQTKPGAKIMGETMARIAEGGKVELVNERMTQVAAPMTAEDAAFLARELFCCAAMLAFGQAKIGALGGDGQIPVLKWTIGFGRDSRMPIVIFSIPPGIDVTFQLSPQVEKELGAALVAHSEGDKPPELPPVAVH
jgi:hypothetical protein